MSWNDLLHSGPLPYPWDNFSKSIENEIQKKKETIWLVEVLAQINSLSGGICWLCVFTCAGEQLHVFLRCCCKMPKPWHLQAGKEMEMQGGVWRDPSDPNELMAELELNHAASLVSQSLSFKLLGSLWVFEVIFERFVAGINDSWNSEQ